MFLIVLTVGWVKSLYEATEGEDSEVQVCAEIFNGTLETTVAAPFIILQTVGMYEYSVLLSVYSKNFSHLI